MPVLLLLALLLSLPGDSAEPVKSLTLKSEMQPISISIETVEIGLTDDTVHLDLMIDTQGEPVGGFELTLETASRLVEIISINQGEFQDSCHWEQFSSRPLDQTGGVKRWHLVSFASLGTIDSTRCFVPDFGQSIARITALVKPPEIYSDTLHPIYFVWSRCSDNSFSDQSGSRLLVGETIDWSLPAPWEPEPTLRAYQGPPMNCFDRAPRPPLKVLRFHNGGLIVRSDIPPISHSDTTSVDTIPPAAADDLN